MEPLCQKTNNISKQGAEEHLGSFRWSDFVVKSGKVITLMGSLFFFLLPSLSLPPSFPHLCFFIFFLELRPPSAQKKKKGEKTGGINLPGCSSCSRRLCHAAEMFLPLGFVRLYANAAASHSLTALMDVSWWISKTALWSVAISARRYYVIPGGK